MLSKITSKFKSIKYEIREQESLISLHHTSRPPFCSIDAHYTKWYAKSRTNNFSSINLIILFPGYQQDSNHERNRRNFTDTLLPAFKQTLFYERISNGNIIIAKSEAEVNDLLKKSYENRNHVFIKFNNELIYSFTIYGENYLGFSIGIGIGIDIDNGANYAFTYNKFRRF